MKTQEVFPSVCPQCQTRHNVSVVSIIDVGSQPELKNALLQGQINVGKCPQCNLVYAANVPVLYHDPTHELALALVPSSLQLAHVDEQKLIGDLTNRLMNALPAEQRRAYLFTPKTFLTFDSLIKAILAADGITEEMIQAQSDKFNLLDKLIQAPDEDALRTLVEANQAQIDYQFFEMATAIAVQAMQDGDDRQGQSLLSFRQIVAEMVPDGQELVAQANKKFGLRAMTHQQLLEDLQQAESEDEFMALLAGSQSMLTYEFFQGLTQQIEATQAAGDTARAEELKALRSKILDVSAKLEEDARQALDQSKTLLDELLQADDPQSLIEANLDNFDDIFLSVLVANIQEAEQNNQVDALHKLSTMYEQIMQTLQKNLPPEVQFLNQLLTAESSAQMRALLDGNPDRITLVFRQILAQARADFESRGQPQVAAAISQIEQHIQAGV